MHNPKMEKLLMISGLLLCLMFGSLVEAVGRPQYLMKQPKAGDKEMDNLDNDLKYLRMELERLNITHEIPGICYVCKWVLGKAIGMIPADDTESHVRTVLNMACGSAWLFGQICRTFVNGYVGKVFIDIVQKHMRDPSAICKALHLCWGPGADKDFYADR
ncbi:hypothetical protein ACEWY4_005282 [Coilia grayii]|uniref:Saposin B-type domain-containing protein n=1 Tax=Coilia grayii TaxID=363190 RepID=A0ABD1KI38_9TELE